MDNIDKEVSLPKGLHELHGEKTRISTLVLVYLTGGVAAALVAVQLLKQDLPVWKTILAAVVFLDVAAGVTANLSSSTNRYYQDKAHLRIGFLALHIFHPAVLTWLFPEAWPYFAAAFIYVLLTGLTVNAIDDPESQQNLAALFVVTGILFSMLFSLPVRVLYSFAPLFLLKLLLGFAVRRPVF